MTDKQFKGLGDGHHHQLMVVWNGKKWRLTETIQNSETAVLQPVRRRKKYPIHAHYKYVELID